jgi:hypothetical protein
VLELSQDCNKFTEALSQIKALHISRTTKAKKEVKAIEHYWKMNNQEKPFTYWIVAVSLKIPPSGSLYLSQVKKLLIW